MCGEVSSWATSEECDIGFCLYMKEALSALRSQQSFLPVLFVIAVKYDFSQQSFGSRLNCGDFMKMID